MSAADNCRRWRSAALYVEDTGSQSVANDILRHHQLHNNVTVFTDEDAGAKIKYIPDPLVGLLQCCTTRD